MANESIERFTAGEHGVLWGYGLGEYVRYSDHERVVKELEAHVAERDALLDPSQPSLSDAIKEVERLYDEWWDVDRRRWLNVVLERLKSLETQRVTTSGSD